MESLEAQRALKGYSDFSLGKTATPPTSATFVPVSQRPEIVARGKAAARANPAWQGASAKRKRILVRDSVAAEMGAVARAA